jgi:two-component system chemotaxis response regulator CheB
LQRGHIYVAPPDHHMTIQGNELRLDRGPVENMCRPAIDPLFRSAASYPDGSVIGVILSGSLDDGTIGLTAIKDSGGTAIVQEPSETAFSGMPTSAIARVNVDMVLPADEIGPQLVELCKNNQRMPRSDAQSETKANPSVLSSFICPECGGLLSETDKTHLPYFSCRVGHKMSADSFLGAQSNNIERALWTAVRALKERADLADRLAERFSRRQKSSSIEERYRAEASDSRREAELILNVILKEYRPVKHLEDSLQSELNR